MVTKRDNTLPSGAAVDPFAPPSPLVDEQVAGPMTSAIVRGIKGAKVSRPTPPGEMIIKVAPGAEARASTLAQSFTSRNLGTFDLSDRAQINFDMVNTTDDVKSVMANLAELNAGKIDEASRGVITDLQLQELANETGGELAVIRDVMTRESGDVLKPETILAARHIHLNSATKLKELAELVKSGNASDRVAGSRE